MTPDIEIALSAARAGANIVRDAFGSHAGASYKGAVDPVTLTDEAAEAAILSVLRSEAGADSVLSEEGGGSSNSNGRQWIVDPLDGTVNFIHGLPHVAVSVALWDGDTPLVGVIIDVIRDEEFAAVRGSGATLNGLQIRCSTVSDPDRALIATGFPYDRQEYAKAYTPSVEAVLERFQGIRRIGSAALDICWVACGRFEGYWEYGLAPWDSAAGVVIAAEAGATVTRTNGSVFSLTARDILVANTGVHTSLVETLAPHFPDHLR